MKMTCPLGHRCEVRDDGNNVVERCQWYTQLRGADPQSGEEVDKWACAIAFMPMLQIETSQSARQTGAAVESFRNKMVELDNKPVPHRIEDNRNE